MKVERGRHFAFYTAKMVLAQTRLNFASSSVAKNCTLTKDVFRYRNICGARVDSMQLKVEVYTEESDTSCTT